MKGEAYPTELTIPQLTQSLKVILPNKSFCDLIPSYAIVNTCNHLLNDEGGRTRLVFIHPDLTSRCIRLFSPHVMIKLVHENLIFVIIPSDSIERVIPQSYRFRLDQAIDLVSPLSVAGGR